MSSERFTLRAASYLLLIKENKVLLLRRYNTGWQDGMYTLVAGHLDGEEKVTEAMAREAKEEAGITINPKDLKVVHIMHRNKGKNAIDKEFIDFYVYTDTFTGKPSIQEKDKADDLQWFDLNNLPENILSYIKQAIDFYRQGISFSELGWDD